MLKYDMNEQYCKNTCYKKCSVQEDQESGAEEKCLFQGNKSDEQGHTTQILGKRNSRVRYFVNMLFSKKQ